MLRRVQNDCKSLVVQRYISNPLLVDGIKFDLRIYVFVRRIDPLEVYLCREGLVRFATLRYEHPEATNLNECRIHLTNYSLNKRTHWFKHTHDSDGTDASKRTLSSFLITLKEKYPDFDEKLFWAQIKHIVDASTIGLAAKLCSSTTFFPKSEQLNQGRLFQVFGVDVLLDDNFRCHLLEVNACPSFSIDGTHFIENESEMYPDETLCDCIATHGPHVHRVCPVDVKVKSVVLHGMLAIILRKGFENAIPDFIQQIYKQRIVALIFKYTPSKLREMEVLLARSVGKEKSLYLHLCKMFNHTALPPPTEDDLPYILLAVAQHPELKYYKAVLDLAVYEFSQCSIIKYSVQSLQKLLFGLLDMEHHDATLCMCILQNFQDVWPVKHEKAVDSMTKFIIFIQTLQLYCTKALPDRSSSEAILELILFKSAEMHTLEQLSGLKLE